MGERSQQWILRRDLQTLIDFTLQSSSYSYNIDLKPLAKRCFLDVPSLACQRKFFQALTICSFKWNAPLNCEELKSLINASLPPQFLFEKLGLKTSGAFDRIPLVLFGGIVEASSFRNVGLTEFLNVPKSFLYSSNPDVLGECIEILNIYVKQRFLNDECNGVIDKEIDLLKTACCRLLPHSDGDNSRVVELTITFFTDIFDLFFNKSRLPEALVCWISSDLIEVGILGSPYCTKKPVTLTKGSVRLIKALVANAPLSWIFERSPYLITSLLLSLGWNYCAAHAGDVIMTIVDRCQRNVNDWLEHVLDPLFNFLSHGVLSCSADRQLRGLPETDIHAAARLRLNNFILHCCKPPLARLPLGDLVRGPQDAPQTENVQLLQQIVYQLALLLEMGNHCASRFFDFRLTVFVALLPLLPLHIATRVIEEHPNLVKMAVQHSSDRIRAQMCKTLAKLVVKSSVSEAPMPDLYLWIFKGVTNLLTSADPSSRDTAIRAFSEVALHLRNRCATCSVGEVDTLTIPYTSGSNGYFDLTPSLYKTATSYLQALGSVYYFAASLWTSNAMGLDVVSEVQTSCLTPFLKEFLSNFVISPGMPYQRQKMLIMLFTNMFELSLVENGKQKSAKCFGFESCTAKNLQRILDRIVEISGFPSIKERTTWLQLIASLPNANSEVQTGLLHILTTYCPPEWLTSDLYADLVRLAETWSDLHLPELYSAGAALFQWMLTSSTDLDSANQLAADLFSRVLELHRDITAPDTTPNRVVQRIVDRPGHGFLAAVDNIFSWCSKKLSIKAQFPQPIFENPLDTTILDRLGDLLSPQLAECCLQLSRTCLAFMGCPCSYHDHEGSDLFSLIADCEASSFETLGRAVLSLSLQAQREENFCDEFKSAITPTNIPVELPPGYHHVLSWSWIVIKITSNILVRWAYLRVSFAFLRNEPLDEMSYQHLRFIGKHLICVLMVCRHKGVVEAVYPSLRDYLIISEYVKQYSIKGQVSIASEIVEKLIASDHVMEVCLEAVKNGNFSVTRHAAGLWPATKAALTAELRALPLNQAQSLLQRWMWALFELSTAKTSVGKSGNSSGREPPQALALHLIKGVLENEQLGSAIFSTLPPLGSDDWLTALVCRVALPNFTASAWTVANGSLQLFSAIVKRLIGSLNSRPATTVADVFGRYPALFDAFVRVLSNHATDMHVSRSAAVPLLSLLSRLDSSPDASFPEESKKKMRECLWRYLSHQSAIIRRLAGKAFAAFLASATSAPPGSVLLPLSGWLGHIFRMVSRDDNALFHRVVASNAISGELFLLESWLERAPTSDEAAERAKHIDWPAAINHINQWTRPRTKSWYLAAQLAQVLHLVFAYIPTSKRPRYHKQFQDLCDYNQWRRQSNDLLNQSCFPLFYSAFYGLYNTLNDFKSLSFESDDIFSTSPTNYLDANVLIHLLSHAESGMDPDLSEVVAGTVLPFKALPLTSDICAETCTIESMVIRCLERLTTWPLTKAQQTALLPSILLATASPITRLNDAPARCKYTVWWVEHLEPCLCIEGTNEHSRLKASRALLAWLDSEVNPAVELATPQLSIILRLLFCGLFDESADVRNVMGRAVACLVGLQHPVCSLGGAHLLLFGLPAFLQKPVDWMRDFFQSQLDAIVNRAENLHKRRVINVCYEPDSINPYLDVQLVLSLLFSALKCYGADKTELAARASAALVNLRKYLPNGDNLRSVALIFTSASLYQATLAKRLASES